MSVVPNSQAPTSLHGPNLRPGPSSASTSGARQEAEHLPQTFKDLSPGSTSSKTYNSLSVGTDSTHPGHSDSGSGRSSAASHKVNGTQSFLDDYCLPSVRYERYGKNDDICDRMMKVH